MGVASGCGEQEVGVASGCGFKEIYIDFLILLIPTPLVSVLFAAASLLLFSSYSSCICTFLQQHPYFFFHFVKMIT